MQRMTQRTDRHVTRPDTISQDTVKRRSARQNGAIQGAKSWPSKGRVKKDGGFDTSMADTYLLRVGPELWSAVIREGSSPGEDTRGALQAIREALEAVRRLRFAACADERQRLAPLAAEAIERQERTLWLWSVGRGSDADLAGRGYG